jgi:invasion protein IalB
MLVADSSVQLLRWSLKCARALQRKDICNMSSRHTNGQELCSLLLRWSSKCVRALRVHKTMSSRHTTGKNGCSLLLRWSLKCARALQRNNICNTSSRHTVGSKIGFL